MKISIEIPQEFQKHFKQDRFKDSLYRLAIDANSESLISGRYEQETARMLIKAFENAEITEE